MLRGGELSAAGARAGGLLALLLVMVAALLAPGAATAASVSKTALIDADSVTTFDGIQKEGTPISLEQYAAEQAGFTVTVASGEEWEAMTAADFAAYQVLIIGDPACSRTPLSAVNSAKTWTPVVMGTSGENPLVGNRTVVGTDPEFHYAAGGGGAQPKEEGNPQSAGAEHLVQDGIAFAGGVAGATGVYFDTSCADIEEEAEAASAARFDSTLHQPELEGPDGRDKTDVLEHLTTTKEGWTEDVTPPCGGSVQQIASNPAFSEGPTKLLDSDIQGWGCSDHVTFPSFPADWFPLAVATDTATHPTCGTDPETKEEVCGEAYVLLAGEGITAEAPNLALEPAKHSDPAGGSHTVTATVTQEGEPSAGVKVTFVVTGQNAGASGTCTNSKDEADPGCETDETGVVKFTYADGNGAGTDTIAASITVGETTEKATASQEWTEEPEEEGETPEPTTLTTSLSGGGQTGANIVVTTGTAVTDTATLAGVNAAKAGGTVTYSVYSNATCTKLLASSTEPVGGGVVPSSEPVTLEKTIKYYWRASYSGDAANQASSSPCGAETVKVVRPKLTCSKISGEAFALEGPERLRLKNTLTTDLKAKGQRLTLSLNHGKDRATMTELERASCFRNLKVAIFKGLAEVHYDHEPEFVMRFTIKITAEGEIFLTARINREGSKEPVQEIIEQELEESTEVIS